MSTSGKSSNWQPSIQSVMVMGRVSIVARMDHWSCPLLLLIRKKAFYRFEVANVYSVTQFAQWCVHI